MKQMLLSQRHASKFRLLALYVFVVATCFTPFAAPNAAQIAPFAFPGAEPADIPETWKPLIGEYGSVHPSLIILERAGKLILHRMNGTEATLQPAPDGNFTLFTPPNTWTTIHFDPGCLPAVPACVGRDRAGAMILNTFDETTFLTRIPEPAEGQVFQIRPARPIDELREKALVASPPHENGQFREPDLVELAPLNPNIHLDIRYATANDFLGTPVYTQARAFLQRPAADALLRALNHLRPHGYGLLIHDAYRPWYVTKIFWDAAPNEGQIFVADPAQGSRHNRGCAVDLTLYDLKTGKPIEMPGTYDEMSERSFPDYPGGTSLQRWHRDLLRWAMESEGFTVYEHEWWHFDYKDWHEYPILNVPFEKLQFTEKQLR